MSQIYVLPSADLGHHWDDLTRRATPNVFAHPAALEAAAATGFAKVHLPLARDRTVERHSPSFALAAMSAAIAS
jgi:hypothetical protein